MSTIRWSPTTSMWLDGAPGTVILGSPGSGKTFFMLNIAANCLGMGQKVVAIDPKDDFKRLYNVNKRIKIIDLAKVKPGAMNPFTFLRKYDPVTGKAQEISTGTLMTIIELLCGGLDKNTQTAIQPIVQDFVTKNRDKGEYVDMMDVANYLFMKDNDLARNTGTALQIFEDDPHGKLLFCDEENPTPLELKGDTSMVISLAGLKLPGFDKKPSEYDTGEKLTSTLLYLLTTKLNDILYSTTKTPTTFFCDEAHLLFANPKMASVIDDYLRLGRSRNCATILASQGITSFPETTSNSVTSKFIFKSSIDEAEAFLDRFDVSKLDPANAINRDNIISAITNFEKGTCFFIDRLNRNGVIKIKSIYDIKLLTSNPFEKTEISADE